MTFRVQTKNVFLTYPDLDKDAENSSEWITWLNSQDFSGGVSRYAVACETHQTGAKHLHCIISFKERIRTSNVKFFDWKDKHPHIKTLKSEKDVQRTLEYISKETTPIIYGSFSPNKWKTIAESANQEEFWQNALTLAPDSIKSFSNLKAYCEWKYSPPAVTYHGPDIDWSIGPELNTWYQEALGSAVEENVRISK